jgi:hypothetical protein
VPAQDGEQVLENNEQHALVHVRDGREKILYFEGEPRFEVGFLRRAVAADSALQVVMLQRAADGKYMRFEVDSAGELLTGFPTTREELFSYRGLILGSIEASHFSHDQLRMIAEFVSERGGGLLMLGGRHAFAEGGYAGTPVADALPVALDARLRDTTFFDTLRVSRRAPARRSRHCASRRMSAVAASGGARCLRRRRTTVSVRKPGALTLLAGERAAFGRSGGTPVLAQQRFGRGQAFALTVQDTWIWQMHADVPLEDETHETFWRQLLRWLVSGAPAPVVPRRRRSRGPGDAVRIASTSGRAFQRVNARA